MTITFLPENNTMILKYNRGCFLDTTPIMNPYGDILDEFEKNPYLGSISNGDSGGGCFDEFGNLLAINSEGVHTSYTIVPMEKSHVATHDYFDLYSEFYNKIMNKFSIEAKILSTDILEKSTEESLKIKQKMNEEIINYKKNTNGYFSQQEISRRSIFLPFYKDWIIYTLNNFK